MLRSLLCTFCVAAAGLLAGCSGSSTVPNSLGPGSGITSNTAQTSQRAAGPRLNASGCGDAVVYAASYDNTVYIYDQRRNGGAACGSVSGLVNPQGLFVDKQRNLWAVNGGNGRSSPSAVYEFAPPNPTPIKTLQDSSGFPVDVVVDNRSGTVYVSNFFENGSAPGVIEVYAGGSTTPTSTLSDPHMTNAFYEAVDDQGNLYVTYLQVTGPSGVGRVDEWIGGTGSATDLGITLKAPGGIQTTSTGALLICDQSAPACGDFAPGSTTMSNALATKDSDPFAIALDAHERHAYVEDTGAGSLQTWRYPGPRAKPMQTIAVPNGAYAGVAASPASAQGLPY